MSAEVAYVRAAAILEKLLESAMYDSLVVLNTFQIRALNMANIYEQLAECAFRLAELDSRHKLEVEACADDVLIGLRDTARIILSRLQTSMTEYLVHLLRQPNDCNSSCT